MSEYICGATGCRNDATHQAETDSYGSRVLCEKHVRILGAEVVDPL